MLFSKTELYNSISQAIQGIGEYAMGGYNQIELWEINCSFIL